MRHFFIMLMVSMLGFGLAVDHAEARRMGGGKSMGGYSRSASPQSNQAGAGAAQTQRKPSAGLSRFAGPFAGLLAGGLLASLFFGGAFDNIRMFDILLIGGAIFLLMRLLGRRRTASASGPASYNSQHDVHHNEQHSAQPQAFQGSAAPKGGSAETRPAWFDEQRFLNDAKAHFMSLQRAWDNNDFASIQDYVTPAFYNELKAERALHPANNFTEIVRLEIELIDIREYVGQTEASVRFQGIIDENGEQSAFSEVWHLIREMRDGAPWYLQGIEQREVA